MRLFLVGPDYDTGIPNWNQQKTVNWYVESLPGNMAAQEIPKYNHILKPTPGITSLFDFGDFSTGRAMLTIEDKAYCIIDNTFIYIDTDGTPNYIDILNTSSGYVSMSRGATGILMADGTDAYYYDLLTLSFSVVTPGFLTGHPTSMAYLDGWYVMTQSDSQVFYFSQDPTSWDALSFESVNSDPNPMVAAVADHEQLWFFGTAVTEVWCSSGDGLAPFIRYSGTVLTSGCTTPFTICAANNTFYWLGTDPGGGYIVYTAAGFTPQAISTPALNAAINQYATVSDAHAFYHRVGLHGFYVLTFPTQGVTWVYDTLEQVWHERNSPQNLGPSSPSYNPNGYAHRAAAHCYAYGTHFVLDRFSGAIAKYDETVPTEFGLAVTRTRRTVPLLGNQLSWTAGLTYSNQRYTYYNLVVDMQLGVGDNVTTDPQLQLNISKDGGYTWRAAGSRSIGPQGVYNKRIKWDVIGQARDLVLEFSVTDPVKAVVLGATVDADRDKG